MVTRSPVYFGVTSYLQRTANWSPLTKGPSTDAP